MKILNKLTLKHLSKNKKRTVVSIVGVILSTALMVGIGLLNSSLFQTVVQENIKTSGPQHVTFQNIDEKSSEELNEISFVESVDYYNVRGFAPLENSEDVVLLKTASFDRFKRLELDSGRYPENSTELVLPSSLMAEHEGAYKLGDQITLNVGELYDSYEETYQRTEFFYLQEEDGKKFQNQAPLTFTIVGSFNKALDQQNLGFLYAYSQVDNKVDELINAEVIYKNPRKSIEYTEELADLLTYDQANYNYGLLSFYGILDDSYANFKNTLSSLMIIMLTILSIGCAVVIYNSFAISTMERTKQFGLYASIGTTQKQIRNSVYFEALLIGAVGIVLGIFSGFLGIFVTLKIINKLLAPQFGFEFIFYADPLLVLIPVLFMIIVIIISAYYPAKKAAKITPIEAIRQSDEIKISAKNKGVANFVGKKNIHYQLAAKNMQRNKGKYRITIISLFISIVLFISFSTFGQVTDKSIEMVKMSDADMEISSFGNEQKLNESKIDNILSEYQITDYLKYYSFGVSTSALDDALYTEEYKDYLGEAGMYDEVDENGNRISWLNLNIVDDKKYEELIASTNGSNGHLIVLNEIVSRLPKDGKVRVETFNVLKSDDFKFEVTEEYKKLNDYPITLSDVNSFGFQNKKTRAGIDIDVILSESMAKESHLLGADDQYSTHIMINSPEYKELYKKIESKELAGIHVYSENIEREQMNNVFLSANILVYGFITLVTLIGVTSVFNTIYTNIMLRRREFAVLRSIGLDPKGFNHVLMYEMFIVGLKSLVFAIPVSMMIVLLINRSLNASIMTGFIIPYKAIAISIAGVFLLVGLATSYSKSLIDKDNILDALRTENI